MKCPECGHDWEPLQDLQQQMAASSFLQFRAQQEAARQNVGGGLGSAFGDLLDPTYQRIFDQEYGMLPSEIPTDLFSGFVPRRRFSWWKVVGWTLLAWLILAKVLADLGKIY